jgi:hypothetical protein
MLQTDAAKNAFKKKRFHFACFFEALIKSAFSDLHFSLSFISFKSITYIFLKVFFCFSKADFKLKTYNSCSVRLKNYFNFVSKFSVRKSSPSFFVDIKEKMNE